LKIRVQQNPVFIDAFNTLGANAVPMPQTEVYTALETGRSTPTGCGREHRRLQVPGNP
jgi:hypothetical protein